MVIGEAARKPVTYEVSETNCALAVERTSSVNGAAGRCKHGVCDVQLYTSSPGSDMHSALWQEAKHSIEHLGHVRR